METSLTIEGIYKMLSTLSRSNKKWLADHLYEDISISPARRKGALSDEELQKELNNAPDLDMSDYQPLTDEQFSALVHSSPIPKNISKWL